MKYRSVEFPEEAAPGTPAADLLRLYAKTDSGLYIKNDAGVEKELFTKPVGWAVYTPVLTAVTTNPSLGTNGEVAGKWLAIGTLIVGHINVLFGSALALPGLGAYRISLPLASVITHTFLGSGMLFDSSVAQVKQVSLIRATGTTAALYLGDAAAGLFEVSHAVPWTWGNNDQMWLTFSYEAA